jgi:predicted Na+-dependent transporter
MSASVFFSEPGPVLIISGIFLFTMYIMGFGYHVLMDKLGYKRPFLISSTLMMVTKSSAFSAVAAFTFFRTEPMVALPSAVVSVFVTLFIIFYSLFLKWYESK